ncbi:MAG: PKD domain-containing protein [Bacteroidetes bacterium]|nr:MAG: PKD domain-containing protein [Bacteroidota bacterium]
MKSVDFVRLMYGNTGIFSTFPLKIPCISYTSSNPNVLVKMIRYLYFHLPRQLCVMMIAVLGATGVLAQPSGFSDQSHVSGFTNAVGVSFDPNGRMYVWEKAGKVWIVTNGVKSATPLIDISQEVGGWRDFGLLGFALDPNFLSNGYIYLLYTVDTHHLLYFGTPSYNANTNQYFDATIGRLTRYQAQSATNFTTVDYSSRTILLGETASTGVPSLHESHGIGSLVFGTDGTLLVSCGDGASYSSTDGGSAPETYWSNAISYGIIPSAHNIGAYRCQIVESLNGKILRLDPATGDGVPSNPYYNASQPRSAASRVWARGVRNPCRMTLKPNSGSHYPADGDPGILYIGDVGRGAREEMSVCFAPGQNFGWPRFEGMTYITSYTNSNYIPAVHTLPKADWRGTTQSRAYVNGTIYNIGSATVPGVNLTGNCSIGGVWYTGTDFPPTYQNTYFHADYGTQWIHNFVMDNNNNILEVRNFKASGAGGITAMATNPVSGALYYVNNGSTVRRIAYAGNLPPNAVAGSDKMYGPGPLTVNFSGAGSTDPENGALSYSWNFGDGSPAGSGLNVSHTFTAPGSGPTSYTITLTVTDNNGQTDQAQRIVSLNNTPPVIQSTSIDNVVSYSMSGGNINQSLTAVVTDAEHSPSQLNYSWVTRLRHDNHSHTEASDNNASSTTTLSPVGCDGFLYFYRIELTVTDAGGLSGTAYRDISPSCDGPLALNDLGGYASGSPLVVPVLANDQANPSPVNPATVQIVKQPLYGTASVNATTGAITYNHTGTGTENDNLYYIVFDQAGYASGLALLELVPGTGSPFPVELISFDASAEGQGIRLNWFTAQEQNSDFFEVERSADGLSYETLARVKAAGISDEVSAYDSFDPFPLPGRSLYRLRMTDLDGTSTHSEAVSVEFVYAGNAAGLFPNPARANEEIALRFYLAAENPVHLDLYDAAGRKIYAKEVNGSAGLNQLSLPGELAAGIYQLRLSISGEVEMLRLQIK